MVFINSDDDETHPTDDGAEPPHHLPVVCVSASAAVAAGLNTAVPAPVSWPDAELIVVSEWVAVPSIPLTESSIGAATGRVAAVELRLSAAPPGDGSEWQLHVFDPPSPVGTPAAARPPRVAPLRWLTASRWQSCVRIHRWRVPLACSRRKGRHQSAWRQFRCQSRLTPVGGRRFGYFASWGRRCRSRRGSMSGCPLGLGHCCSTGSPRPASLAGGLRQAISAVVVAGARRVQWVG